VETAEKLEEPPQDSLADSRKGPPNSILFHGDQGLGIQGMPGRLRVS